MNDFRFAFRQLLKNPGFTAVAVLTLALGIGANTALFSVLNQVLFRELPYRRAGELVLIAEANPTQPGQLTVATPASYFDWRDQCQSFSDIAAVAFANFNLSGMDLPERLQAGMATANFFGLLGVEPLLGRDFRPEEGTYDRHFVVIISHAFWQRRFGGAADVIGRTLTLNGNTHTIIGVLPSTFRFEHPVGLEGWASGWGTPEVWRPIPFGEADRKIRDAHWLLALARMKPAISVAQSQAELETVSRRVQQENPNYGWGVRVMSWHERVVGYSRPALAMLSGAAAFVLLIGCANIAHLLLARASVRRKEFAIRVALGAGRWMVARQLMCEGLLLSAFGGAIGLGLAHAALRIVTQLGSAALPRLKDVDLDWHVLIFAAALCMITTLLFGLVPLVNTFRIDLDAALREGSRSSSESIRRNPLRSALVIAEVTAAIVLLSAAGLLIRSFWATRQIHPGFETEQMLAVDVSLVDNRLRHPAARIAIVQRMLEAARAVPGVQAAASVYGLPFGSMINDAYAFSLEGVPAPRPNVQWRTAYRMASPDYFRLLNVPLLAGRNFTAHDNTNAPPVAIVNRTFVRQFFPHGNPLGQRVRVADAPEPWEIVGVVGDVKADGLDAATPPELYRPHTQACDWYLSLVMHAAGDTPAFREALRKAINAVNANCPIYNVRQLESQIARSMAPRRFTLAVTWLLAAGALGLAAVGVYGVMAYTVSRRTRELGIRIAVGASKGKILRLIFRDCMILVSAGTVGGILLSIALLRVLASRSLGVPAFDLATFAFVIIVLNGVAAVACWIPANRAANVDPIEALRNE